MTTRINELFGGKERQMKKDLVTKEREKRKTELLKIKAKAQVDREEKQREERAAKRKALVNKVKSFVFSKHKSLTAPKPQAQAPQKKPSALPPPIPKQAPAGSKPGVKTKTRGSALIKSKLQKAQQYAPKSELNKPEQASEPHSPEVDNHMRNHAKWLQAAHRAPPNNVIRIGQVDVNAKQYYHAQAEHIRGKLYRDHGISVSHEKKGGNLHTSYKRTTNPPPALAGPLKEMNLLKAIAISQVNKQFHDMKRKRKEEEKAKNPGVIAKLKKLFVKEEGTFNVSSGSVTKPKKGNKVGSINPIRKNWVKK